MIRMAFNSDAYALMKAVMVADLAAIDAALLKKPDLDWQSSEGSTSLHIAAKLNRPEIIEKLTALGARLDIRDNSQRTPLGVAAEDGNEDAVKMLLAKGAAQTPDENALNLAAENKRHGVAKLLIDAEMNVDFMPTASPSAVMLAAQNDDVPMLEILNGARPSLDLRDMRNSTALHRTAWKNAKAAATWLMEKGADERLSNIDGATPAIIAEHNEFDALGGIYAKGERLRAGRAAEQERKQREAAERQAAFEAAKKEAILTARDGAGVELASPEQAQFKSKKFTLQ